MLVKPTQPSASTMPLDELTGEFTVTIKSHQLKTQSHEIVCATFSNSTTCVCGLSTITHFVSDRKKQITESTKSDEEDEVSFVSATTTEVKEGIVIAVNENEENSKEILRYDAGVHSIATHPSRLMFCVGFDDGVVAFCPLNDDYLKENLTFNSIHYDRIIFLTWSDDGRVVLSVDSSDKAVLWVLDEDFIVRPALSLSLQSGFKTAKFLPSFHEEKDAITVYFGIEKTVAFFETSFEELLSFASNEGSNLQSAEPTESNLTFSDIVETLCCSENKNVLHLILTNGRIADLQIGPRKQPRMTKITSPGGKYNVKTIHIENYDYICYSSIPSKDRSLTVTHWNNKTQKEFALPLSAELSAEDRKNSIMSIAFDKNRRILCVELENKKLLCWSFTRIWKPLIPLILPDDVLSLSVGKSIVLVTKGAQRSNISSSRSLMSDNKLPSINATTKSKPIPCTTPVWQRAVVFISFSQPLSAFGGDKHTIALFQVNSYDFEVTIDEKRTTYHSTDSVENVSVIGDILFFTHQDKVSWAQVTQNSIDFKQSLPLFSNSHLVGYFPQRSALVSITSDGTLCVLSESGVRKQSIVMNKSEGKPTKMNVNGLFFAILTELNYLKAFDIQKRELRIIGIPFLVDKQILGEVEDICISNDGTRIAFRTRMQKNDALFYSSNVFVFLVETSIVLNYDFAIENRFPIRMVFDSCYSRLLICETLPLLNEAKREEKTKEIIFLYAPNQNERNLNERSTPQANTINNINIPSTAQNQLQLSALFRGDSFECAKGTKELLGSIVPFVYLSMIEESDRKVFLQKKPMKDFVGMDSVDEHSKFAILSFGFNLSIGNIDEAFQSISKINNPNVWENMSHMIVKTTRIDRLNWLSVCLANMGLLRAAQCLRESIDRKDDPKTSLGLVAIHLKMYPEAERLLTDSNRFDLLNGLYQDCGKWDKALKIATQNDRIHLSSTHFNRARFLETIGNYNEAQIHYEESKTAFTEIPRMFYESGQDHLLNSFIESHEDPQVLQWKAKLCESRGEIQKAIECYEKAKDYRSVVRLLCNEDNIEKAEEIANETKSSSAIYFLARKLESMDTEESVKKAIRYYNEIGLVGRSVRVSLEHSYTDLATMHSILSRLSTSNKNANKIATVFTRQAQRSITTAANEGILPPPQCALLYKYAGKINDSINICINEDLEEQAWEIAQDFTEKTEPDLLMQCAEYFTSKERYDRAVHCYINAKQTEKALKVCLSHNVEITDEMADTMIPPVDSGDSVKRNKVLQILAKCALKQNSYQLAVKMYTLANDNIKAMKALLQSGEKEKIISYAMVSKQQEIYIMAANYLQTLDWKDSPDLMKTIIAFYRRAKAMESLALFYQACAQVEIDECQDYEKALSALHCAAQYLGRLEQTSKQEKMVSSLVKKIQIVEAFVTVKKMIETNANQALEICQALMQGDPIEIEEAIRIGDVYALVIGYYHSLGEEKIVINLLNQMKQRGINIAYFISESIWKGLIQLTQSSLNHRPIGSGLAESKASTDDEIEDRIEEDYEEDDTDGGMEMSDLFIQGHSVETELTQPKPPQIYHSPQPSIESEYEESDNESIVEEIIEDEEVEYEEIVE